METHLITVWKALFFSPYVRDIKIIYYFDGPPHLEEFVSA